MSEQKNYNKIEDAIIENLDGELKETALKFAAYLNENQLTPNMSAWGKIPFNGYNLGWMRVEGKNEWLFEIFNYLKFGEFNDGDEEFNKTVHDHVNICDAPCHDECWRAKDVKVFGKEFKSVCSQHSRAFVNPDGKTIEHIKKLIEYSKKTVPYEQQYHPNFL
jgi:AAA+ ATPase superfamily predicted ATPase